MVRDMPVASDPDAVLGHVGPGADLIVPLANGEPVALLDAIEAHGDELEGVRVHQMHALHDRRYLHGAFGDRLRHVSYFLSHVTRPCLAAGTIELVPNNFSEMRAILAERTVDPLVIAASSPQDRHGYFSLGLNADYVSSFIGRARFFLEANVQMPRTFGRNQIHVSQVLGWVDVDRPLVEVPPPSRSAIDDRIAAFVAERIPNGATIQTGIGSIPNAILAALSDHRDLGVHTELLSDGLIDLVDAGVVNGVAKQINRTKAVGTFALGTRHLYDFLDANAAFELLPVRYVTTLASSPKRTGSCRSTRRSPSTCSVNAPAKRSVAPTTPRAAAKRTSPAARCTPKVAKGSSCSTPPPSRTPSPRSLPSSPPAMSSRH